ncbi:hypothetical protein GCM10007913_34290 [Devosia yakushimensis]|uniref:BioF2-like acetyltransferase domain-containing protein n=1 Tax=Devosia yakushimensis TaxID=470028 RepID=A0ABQ5UHJ5_9HYPH|nr:GNAT family N-acetyltransferase [Devosia yakushimensis]GLQ11497.1 hypothetical protein GCM10007913_34290 [Devosia yakushimensis]
MSLLSGQMQSSPASLAGPELDFVLFDTLEAAEAGWRALEQDAVLTPYQRFDWIAALIASGTETADRIAIALIRDHGQPMALLPLAIERRFGVARARLLGTKQSNSDWLLALPGFAPDPATLRGLLQAIGRAAGGVDLLSLNDQPATWQGYANIVLPLAQALAASHLYLTTIGPTPPPYIEHRLTTKRRGNIRRSVRRLEETYGPVRVVRIADPATLSSVHQVFLTQRGERFAEMGVRNIFADAGFVALFRDLTAQSFGQYRPAMCLHALYAGEEILATCWGATAGNHYSQYINSTASGPAAKYSLSAVLVAGLMDDLNASGFVTFDMGLGDFDYKIEWTEPAPVYHSLIALTGRGRLAAAAMERRDALKRLVKQTPAFWSAAKWLRRQVFRLRG